MSMQSEFPKCPICGSISGYELSGLIGKYAKCLQCMSKWKLLFGNQRITGLMLRELPNNGAALYKVTSTNAPLYIEIDKPFGLAFWKNLELDGKIDWNYLSKNLENKSWNSLVKEEAEMLLCCWNGKRSTGKWKYPEGSTINVEASESGILLLTSHRLVFLEKFANAVVSEIRLENIKGISGKNAGHYIFLSITDGKGENKFWPEHTFLELIKPMIENAIKMRREKLDAERKKERVHVLLDFSFLRNIMEKGGLIMQVLKCPECGATVDFPKSGNATKCDHCGKAIYAQDVFEKIKDLV